MTKKKKTYNESNLSGSHGALLFPTLSQVAKEIQEIQAQFERLSAENQELRAGLNQRRQELVQAQGQATDLTAECESLRREVELAQAEVERSRTDALVALFKDLADERHNRLLRKLLALDNEDSVLLRNLSRYLRDELKLTLEGQVGEEVELGENNLDHYALREAVDLPCRARIIGRGISFEGQPVLRTQVELIEEGGDDGN